MRPYNATVRRLDALTGKELGVFRADVDARGRMLRSSWIRFSRLEGSVRYDAYLRRTGDAFVIERDGAGEAAT